MSGAWIGRPVRAGLAALLLAGCFAYGFLCAWYRIFPYSLLKRGYESIVGVGLGTPEADVSALLTVPYLQGYHRAQGREQITIHEPGRAYRGLNLFTSGHAPQAFLMDMDGRVLHAWRYEFAKAWPGRVVEPENRFGDRYWRRAHLFENGDLLAIFEGLGLVKLDARSRLLWAYDGDCHHDLAVGADGSIRVLTRRHTTWRGQPALEDHVSTLDAGGALGESVSLLHALLASDYAALLDVMPRRGDLLHTNRLQILSDSAAPPPFENGRALVSFYQLNAIALLDLERERAVWAMAGLWRRQHDPTLLPGGRLLVFDNQWDPTRKRSRVLEIDPLSQQIAWDYGRGEAEPFFTPGFGECQRLPNGNTLIVESWAGRAFEVTPDRRIVWEFVSPFRTGERGELRAALVQLRRLPPDFPFRGSGRDGSP